MTTNPIGHRGDIRRKLDILKTLLAQHTTVHPPCCQCAIKSRDEAHHAFDCPYRTLKEVIAVVEILIR